MKCKKKIFLIGLISIVAISICVIKTNEQKNNVNQVSVLTSSSSLSNQRICWGIKRADNHLQPDLGAKNKEIMDKYEGISMGNAQDKYVYLTFDEGYEAGYTPRILQVLKENDVKAAFFITAHFANTQEALVQEMINDGHVVGNHTPNFLMSRN